MSESRQLSADELYRTLRRAILFAAGLCAHFIFLDAVTFIILFFVLAAILELV